VSTKVVVFIALIFFLPIFLAEWQLRLDKETEEKAKRTKKIWEKISRMRREQ